MPLELREGIVTTSYFTDNSCVNWHQSAWFSIQKMLYTYFWNVPPPTLHSFLNIPSRLCVLFRVCFPVFSFLSQYFSPKRKLWCTGSLPTFNSPLSIILLEMLLCVLTLRMLVIRFLFWQQAIFKEIGNEAFGTSRSNRYSNNPITLWVHEG